MSDMSDMPTPNDPEVRVLSVMENGINGHYSIQVQVIETLEDGQRQSPISIHGIDGLALERLYGTDVDQALELWLASVKVKALAEYRIRSKVGTGLHALVGKTL